LGHEALVALLVDYYLRPADAVRAKVTGAGLSVPGFVRPIPLTDTDRALLGEWLTRRVRPRSAHVVYNTLDRLRTLLVEDLARLEAEGGPPSPWREDLRLGVAELRNLARERFDEIAGGDEAAYQELCHRQHIVVHEQRLRLSPRARRDIDAAIGRALSGLQLTTESTTALRRFQ
jgi:hypothetical protein